MNLQKERLSSLIEFAKQSALLKKTPLQHVSQHKDFLRLEEKVQGLPGLTFNAAVADFDEVWLRLERLSETPPPAPASQLLELWIELTKAPNKEPVLKAQVARQALLDIDALTLPVASGELEAPNAGVTPEMASPFMALEDFPDLEVLKGIPFKVLPFSPVVLRDRQEKRDVVRGTGSV